MDVYFNQTKVMRAAHRTAVANNKPQPVVAMLGGWVIPTADEFEFECLGAPVVAVFIPETIH